ncbi:hypothetical protein [Paenibacillus segetis]|uniref:Uncharacterized protein n=1 Tax=Paenibacillus segetis TaxID=1325360 RepID=A0ABQ1YA65_9BACL|nr:hypothetical protein [Paenibacillus segetis]GGH17114.1 hypothetical protein GCM10008013_12280 [Paenibacillus segetis]
MSGAWSKWSVYEYMRHKYMWTGRCPDMPELLDRFPGMPLSEIKEGMKEFELTITIGGGKIAK